MKDLIKEVQTQKLDKCVLCSEDTPYTENTNINYRNYYIEGAGQLCESCYSKVYDKQSNNELILG